jgi:hypothetical protein
MDQSPSPTIGQFVRVAYQNWATLMSGALTVPFTALATFLPSTWNQTRPIFGVMAVLLFAFTMFRVWAIERDDLIALEKHLAPRLRIEFDPTNQKFVVHTRAANSGMIYIRVVARALSPTVRKCEAYLTRISCWEGERYVPVFEEQLRLPWSNTFPPSTSPLDLNHDVDGLLDVAWLAEANNQGGFEPFGFINHTVALPNSIRPVLNRHFQHPGENLKLDILLTGMDSANATLSLNIHRGARSMDQVQIGWMDGLAIMPNANFS